MQQQTDIGLLLAHQPLFRSLDNDQRSLMTTAARKIRVSRSEFVFRRGDTANGLYMVAVGHIVLAVPAANGQQKIIDFMGPGNAFGEAFMFLDQPYMIEAQALEDSLLIWIDKQDIYAAIDRDPSFARRMLAGLSMRLHTLVKDIETINLQNAMQRIVAYLLNQPCKNGETRLPFKKGMIASKLGVSAETLSRLLHQLMDENLITMEGKRIRILDAVTLEKRLYQS